MKLLFIVLLTLSVFLESASPIAAQTLKLGTRAPAGSPWYEALRDMAESWQVASQGVIDVRIYAGGVAGDDLEIVRRMNNGQLHAAALTVQGLSAIAPETRAFQMPMILRTDDELDYVLESVTPELERIFETKGFKVLYWGNAGWLYILSRRPVSTPEDLKSLKIWVSTEDTPWAQVLKRSGYGFVALPVSEVYPALQTGQIDAVVTTPAAAIASRWFGMTKHMIDLRWALSLGALVISTEVWEQIPEDVRPLLHDAALKTKLRAMEKSRKLEKDSIATMQKYGLTLHAISPAMAPRWNAEFQAIYSQIAGSTIPKDFVVRIDKLRKQYVNRPREGGMVRQH